MYNISYNISKYFNIFLYGETVLNKITILIPVYNEVDTLRAILEKVENADFCGLEKEIILIDDCSTDGTKEIYPSLPYKVLYHDVNQGKGAALRDGFKEATGDIIVIQDADLEYDPVDYKDLIKLILENKAVVYFLQSIFMLFHSQKTDPSEKHGAS